MAPAQRDEAESESLKSSSSCSEDEELESENAQKPFFSKKVEITNKPSGSLSGEEEDEDEGESEEGDDEAPPPIEPKNTASSTPPAKSIASAKRVAAETENVGDRESKRAKKKSDEETKKSFARVFAEDDEVVILKGMVEYMAETGVFKIDGFRDYIYKSLPFEATKIQLYEKIRRLRKRYENNSKKGKSTFKIAHDQKIYDLSKKIWETEEANNAVEVHSKADDAEPEIKHKKKKETMIEANTRVVSPMSSYLRKVNMSVEELVIKHGLDIINGPKKLELEEKWKQYRVEEMKLYLKRLRLLTEQGKLVLNAMEH